MDNRINMSNISFYWREKPLTQFALIASRRIARWLIWEPFSTAFARLQLAAWGAQVGEKIRVCGILDIYNNGTLCIGSGVFLNSGTSNYVGGDRRIRIWTGPRGKCEIGDNCGLSNLTIVSFCKITIGCDTYIGGGCEIYDTDFHQIEVKERMLGLTPIPVSSIYIGNYVFIGAYVKILKGSQIGDGAVIGAGSVVTGEVPPFEVWAGVPARYVRKLKQEI